jgi:hypothetical protein
VQSPRFMRVHVGGQFLRLKPYRSTRTPDTLMTIELIGRLEHRRMCGRAHLGAIFDTSYARLHFGHSRKASSSELRR